MLAVALAGCHSPSQYISPRVMGRVVNAQTGEPIANVRVVWQKDTRSASTMEPLKGAEHLRRQPPERTDAAGAFNVASARDLSFFRRLGWYGGNLSFSHFRYERLLITCWPTNVVHSPSGEPLIEAGDILLSPKAEASSAPNPQVQP